MIAMPYILVNIVLDTLSIPFFSLTSAALLFGSAPARRYLPKRLATPAWVSFLAHAFVITSLAAAAGVFVGRMAFHAFAYAGFVNSLVLVYRFLGKRCFLRGPEMLRRLLVALLAVTITIGAVVAVEAVVIVLFVIR